MPGNLHLVGGVRRDAADAQRAARASYARPALDAAPRRLFVGPYSLPQYQEAASSCVPHGSGACVESDIRRRSGADFQVNRTDVYRGGRAYRGWENQDAGMLLSDAVRWQEAEGVVSEGLEPYDPGHQTNNPAPPKVVAARRIYVPKWASLASVGEQIAAHMAHRETMVAMTFAVGGSYTRTDMSGGLMLPFSIVDGWHCEAWAGYDLDAPGGPELWKWGSWARFGVDHPDAESDPRWKHLRGLRGFTRIKFSMIGSVDRFGELFGLVSSPKVEA